MLTLAWTCNSLNGKPYPVLWYGDVPSEKTSTGKYMIKQQHVITGDEEAAVWAQPDGTRTDYAAKKYPYNDPNPVDTEPKTLIVTEVTDELTATTEAINDHA